MIEKSGNFLEQHLEKMILALAAVLAAWLFITRAAISPNRVKYNNKECAPADVDFAISRQAENLEQRLEVQPQPPEPYQPKYDAFTALVDGQVNGAKSYAKRFPAIAKLCPHAANYAISDVNPNIILPNPSVRQLGAQEDREYLVPAVGKVLEPSLGFARAMAYVPTVAVDQQHEYAEKNSEPNDIDFVTVEAKFNVSELYKSFYESFAGVDVPEEWRDPCLAVPVFAAVQLERQELLAHGSWSDWKIVPRARIDPRKNMFELKEVGQLPLGGIRVRLLQFGGWEVARHLLQPDAYRIASAEEEWFPPSLRDKYLDVQGKQEALERREETEKKEREREEERARPSRDRGPSRGRSSDTYPGRDTGVSDEYDRSYRSRPPTGFGVPGKRAPRPSAKKEAPKTTYGDSMNELYDEFGKFLITELTNLSAMTEPLRFWAHDDTVEPGRTYRYRIRLGVFNPVAGKNQISAQTEPRKDDIILWSSFSKATDAIDIPGRLYFFPLREAGKVVTIQVSRYLWGYWYNWNFPVQQGEVIGSVVANKETNEEAADTSKDVKLPDSVDYTTGAVLVDVTTVNGWSGGGGANLSPRYYPDILYSFDGTTIEHLPVGYGYWPKQLQIKFNEIKKLAERPKKAWRRWISRPGDTLRYTPRRTDESDRREDGDKDSRRSDGEEEAWQRMMGRRGR
ncbi:MAG TPA: hypothetical protein VMX13_09860 [Sedimentisphaerales bacterium]|nr:hypothetical protein [Sedimentisphaerales bacterium]